MTAGESPIVEVLAQWAAHAWLGDVEIEGIVMAQHDSPARCSDVADGVKTVARSRGALVATRKLDLFAATRDICDMLDPHARPMGETSCLPKRNGKLIRHA